MKSIEKYLKKIPIKKRRLAEEEINKYIKILQNETKVNLKMSLKDFIISRR